MVKGTSAEAECARPAISRRVRGQGGGYREAGPLWCEDHAPAHGCCGHCGCEVGAAALSEIGYCYECALAFKKPKRRQEPVAQTTDGSRFRGAHRRLAVSRPRRSALKNGGAESARRLEAALATWAAPATGR
jgi:hypothetical protein